MTTSILGYYQLPLSEKEQEDIQTSITPRYIHPDVPLSNQTIATINNLLMTRPIGSRKAEQHRDDVDVYLLDDLNTELFELIQKEIAQDRVGNTRWDFSKELLDWIAKIKDPHYRMLIP